MRLPLVYSSLKWIIAIVLVLSQAAPAAPWQRVPSDLMTDWATKVSSQHPLPEYPRPQMVRQQWENLNGPWDYALLPKDDAVPQRYDGKILVPFGVESALSGVKKPLLPEQRLWYRRSFATPDLSGGKRLLLHFGAVDWQATVYLNGNQVGMHRGGYDGFTLDITEALKPYVKPVSQTPSAKPEPRTPVTDQKPPKQGPTSVPALDQKSRKQEPGIPAQDRKPPKQEPMVAPVKTTVAPAKTKEKDSKSASDKPTPTPTPTPLTISDQAKKPLPPSNASGASGVRPKSEMPPNASPQTKEPVKQSPAVKPAFKANQGADHPNPDQSQRHHGRKSSDKAKNLVEPDRGLNELVVCVWDPTDTGTTAFGKQSLHPQDTSHTATSGIWQTVWMEMVPSVSIDRLEMTPDMDLCRLMLTVKTRGEAKPYTVEAVAKGRSRIVGMVTGKPNERLAIDIQEVRVWHPEDPFLYELTVALKRDGQIIDTVKSYFAMRKIEVGRDAVGHDRVLLNGRPVFNIGLLDQGFWPEGLYTAPTDEALRFDIEAAKRMGFNTIRKHVKVEPDRWYYHCDRLGVLVWQDVVSRTVRSEHDTPEARQQFETEIQAMIHSLSNHPSVVMWNLFNEGWGAYDQSRLATWIKRLDPTRLVNTHSGGDARGDGDIVDIHSSHYGQMPHVATGKACVIGAVGGVVSPIAGHEWRPKNSQGPVRLKAWEIALFYEDMTNRLRPLIASGLCGAIYVQPYDLETEQNGLMTYDRKVFKISPELLHVINQGLLQTASARLAVVVPTAEHAPQVWTYTTQSPKPDWNALRFDETGWNIGLAPFGAPPQARTRWNTKELWLRRTFTVDKALKLPRISLLHNGPVEVYIDGRLATACTGASPAYTTEAVLPGAAATLTPGKHMLAVHCSQGVGGPAFDAGIAEFRVTGNGPSLALPSIPLAPQIDPRFAPGGKWLEHDTARPIPPVIETAGAGPMGLQALAPSDAVVLFDGKDLAQWQSFESGLSGPAMWKVENGYMEVAPKNGNIYSRQKFGDCQIHIEWSSPAQVQGKGQGRGNSGIFPLGFGEVQVLDSFQNETYADGQAGALYGKYPPMVNAARRPGFWQAYDIVIHTARLDKQGRVVRPARMTIFLNGVVLHHAVEMQGRQREGTLGLQDHQNPVRYRNIWVRKLIDYDVKGTPPAAAKDEAH